MKINNRGFTLVELIVSVTLSSLIMLGLYSTLNTYLNLWKSGSRDMASLQDSVFVLNQITRDVRLASKINSASDNAKLVLDYGSDSLVYDFFNAKIRRRKNWGAGSYLTDENIIRGIVFDYPSSKRVAVSIEIFQGRAPKPFLITAESGVRI